MVKRDRHVVKKDRPVIKRDIPVVKREQACSQERISVVDWAVHSQNIYIFTEQNRTATS